jgi:hypothetical protein
MRNLLANNGGTVGFPGLSRDATPREQAPLATVDKMCRSGKIWIDIELIFQIPNPAKDERLHREDGCANCRFAQRSSKIFRRDARA